MTLPETGQPGGRAKRASQMNVQPMPVIAEDDDSGAPPTLPEKSARRAGRDGGGRRGRNAPRESAPCGEKGARDVPDRIWAEPRGGGIVKDKEWLARRGGWYRLGLAAVMLVVAIVVGLAVGLTLGLRKRQHSNSGSDSLPEAASLFPAGSYTFTAALTNVSTACTSDPSTFRCFPYSLYSPISPAASSVSFSWVITAVNSYTYAISSSADPFAPQFSNVTMALLDGNQPTERFVFAFALDKAVAPAEPLAAASGAAATCYFNGTVMSATLWTRMRAAYPANITAVPAPVNASTTFAPWPYAVEVAQVQHAGAGVPDCRDSQGRPVGHFDIIDGGNETCGCWYSNIRLGNGTVSSRRKP